MKGVDRDGVAAGIDNYCMAHPTDILATAAWAFFQTHPR
jgi:hypothetical protein